MLVEKFQFTGHVGLIALAFLSRVLMFIHGRKVEVHRFHCHFEIFNNLSLLLVENVKFIGDAFGLIAWFC